MNSPRNPVRKPIVGRPFGDGARFWFFDILQSLISCVSTKTLYSARSNPPHLLSSCNRAVANPCCQCCFTSAQEHQIPLMTVPCGVDSRKRRFPRTPANGALLIWSMSRFCGKSSSHSASSVISGIRVNSQCREVGTTCRAFLDSQFFRFSSSGSGSTRARRSARNCPSSRCSSRSSFSIR